MRRFACGSVVAFIAVVAAPEVSSADQVIGTPTGGIIARDSSDGKAGSAIARRRDGRRWYPYRLRLDDGNGGYCLATRWTPDKLYADLFPKVRGELGNVLAPPAASLDCPRSPKAERSRQLVEKTWLARRQLEQPQLSIQPGFGVTGKRVFLTIGGKPTDDFDIWNPVDEEMIEVEATSTYVIDWGDRFNPKDNRMVTESQGGPWRDGDLTHVYTTVDPDVTIKVTQRWTATWFAGDEAGVLEGLETEAAIDDYVVGQIQAVRIR